MLFSCSETKKENVVNQSEIENTENKVASYKSIEVDIKGKTCEIGCARTIESKLSKVDGISYSKVDFESGKGQFTFDENKLSENGIEFRRGLSGGGNQMRQPFFKSVYQDFSDFPVVEHIHNFSWYVGNYPGLGSRWVITFQFIRLASNGMNTLVP